MEIKDIIFLLISIGLLILVIKVQANINKKNKDEIRKMNKKVDQAKTKDKD